jgi:hypothetical protein
MRHPSHIIFTVDFGDSRMIRKKRAWIAYVCSASLLAATCRPTIVHAEHVASWERPQKAEFVSYDVKLEAGGKFTGKLTDAGGIALVRAPVVIYQGRNELASTRTDEQGYFEFDKLRGGTYQLYTVGRQGMIRAWTPEAAPPGASESLLVATDYRIVRGQYDLNSVLNSAVIPIVVVTSAAIAIPIIVSENKDKKSSS